MIEQDGSLFELVQDIFYWACVTALTLFTGASFIGFLGYAIHRWF